MISSLCLSFAPKCASRPVSATALPNQPSVNYGTKYGAALAFGFTFELLGDLFDFFGLLVHPDGEDIAGGSLLHFVVKFAGELIEAFDASAKLPLIFLKRSFRGLMADVVRGSGGRILFLGWLWRVWKPSPVLREEQRFSRSGAASDRNQCKHKPASGFAHGGLLWSRG
jgi:hypothetical protein